LGLIASRDVLSTEANRQLEVELVFRSIPLHLWYFSSLSKKEASNRNSQRPGKLML
jgi:hypothetical protein